MPGRPLAALAAALLLALALAGCGGSTGGDGSGTGAAVGTVVTIPPDKRTAAPTLAGELLDGGRFDPGGYRGDVVVVNFWASWCAPCRVEAADLEAVHQATAGNGVSFVGININDVRDKAKAFVAGRSTYENIYDPSGRLALGFKVPPNTLPATLIIDRQGRLAVVIRKSISRDALEPLVNQVAAEKRG